MASAEGNRKRKMYSLWESASQNPKDENLNDPSEERSQNAPNSENAVDTVRAPSLTKMKHPSLKRHQSGGGDQPEQRLAECDKSIPAKHTTDLRAEKEKLTAYGGFDPSTEEFEEEKDGTVPPQSNDNAHMAMYIHDVEEDSNMHLGAIAVPGPNGTTQSSCQEEEEESNIWREASSNTEGVMNENPDTPVLHARIVERDDPSGLAEEVRHLREEMAHGLWIPEGENVVPAQAMTTETTKGVSTETQKRRRRRLTLLVSVVVLVAIAVVLGIVFGGRGGGGSGSEQEALEELLLTEPLVDNNLLNDTDSPQYKAKMWLMNNTFLKDYPDWQRLQRFALATLYFNTNGDNWNENKGWLSDENECGWYNDDPERCDDWSNLIRLALEYNNMNGKIPVELGLLSGSLIKIVFAHNTMTGTIPSEIGLLRRMGQLFLNQNSLTGTIPTEIGSFNGVAEFFLDDNALTGSIPSEIGLMAPTLGRILFGNNHLTGTIPTELALLPVLEMLRIEHNRFTGSIPTEVGLATSRMAWISIHDCALTGTIPNEISSLALLQRVNLQNNFLTGTIPEGTLRMQNLGELTLYNNSLTGNYTCAVSVPTCMISCDNSSVACRSL